MYFRILDKNGGRPPLTYNKFQKILAEMDLPPRPLETVTASDFGNCRTPLSVDHDEKYGVPTLEELGKYFSKSSRNSFSL